ncbi:hypothetical protein [Halarsenatibacter silvermanii]|uniref:hypothetical protein n=1 Tax=Halarsenatibacter silvermanii TaxID=321763 RepID=UPI0013563000|nr:hypothetical protein [Halarsenatibacter silvermanii]
MKNNRLIPAAGKVCCQQRGFLFSRLALYFTMPARPAEFFSRWQVGSVPEF